jgi:hypothetical protein
MALFFPGNQYPDVSGCSSRTYYFKKAKKLIQIMQFNNADVVKKFIFRYLDLPLTDDSRNILVNLTEKNIPNKFIELNKFLNNVCIIWVNWFSLQRKEAPVLPHYGTQDIYLAF